MTENTNTTYRSVDGVILRDDVVPVYHLADFQTRLKTLTSKERIYFNVMLAQYGVLFLVSKPGIGKSAIARSIARKMGLQYIDIRLSMADETDMQFPKLTEREFAKNVKISVIEHAVPEWAILSNDTPTLIHFEELNRSSDAVRNAALQILLERGIGYKFNFNKNVYMMASGNQGLADNTSVSEFDDAVANRLIHLEHDLTAAEWIEWGEGIIHPDILAFIDIHKDKFSVKATEGSRAFATARSWTMLSELIINNFGGGAKVREVFDENGNVVMVKPKDDSNERIKPKLELVRSDDGRILHFPDGYNIDERTNLLTEPLIRNWGAPKDYIGFLEYVAHGVVGDSAATTFLRFIRNRDDINLTHIITDYVSVRDKLRDNYNRDKYSELIASARKTAVQNWNKNQIDNFVEFMRDCQMEERIAYILYLVDYAQLKVVGGTENVPIKYMISKFQDELKKIKKLNGDNVGKQDDE